MVYEVAKQISCERRGNEEIDRVGRNSRDIVSRSA